MSEWILTYEGFDPDQEGLREALCTLGNGYFATRGAAPESKDDGVHYPGTYLAGGYNRRTSEIAEHTIENEDLVNLPNWLCLSFRVRGEDWFDASTVEILSYRQRLHLHEGLFHREIRFRDRDGRQTLLRSRRLVHMALPHIAATRLELVPENWSGEFEIRSAIDGRVVNNGVARYRSLANRHLETLAIEPVGEEGMLLKSRTNQSHIEIAEAVRTRVFCEDQLLHLERDTTLEADFIAQDFRVDVAQGQPVAVEKILALYTSRDKAISEAALEAISDVQRAEDFASLEASQIDTWKDAWERIDLQFEVQEDSQQKHMQMVLHLYTFHILQTVSRHSLEEDVGVPSRGWHGEAYRGHILWDELFILPFLNLRLPAVARSLLLYRYRRLRKAREAARAAGHRGAMYPWQSGSNGREESQKIHLNPQSGRWIPDHSRLQRHVNATIAFNVWQYYEASGDMDFLCHYGAEMVWEIARFWASKATYNPQLDRYEILGVMGPDEFHDGYPDAKEPGINNNAYTNLMVVWVMNQATKLFDLLPRDRSADLVAALDLTENERQRWKDIARKMLVVFHEDGIISQFEGYDRLEEFDWDGYRQKYGNIQRLDRILEAEDDTVNRYKASKQADVLMLFYLFSAEQLRELFGQLGYEFTRETIPKNINYYLQRTSHGSTLSWVVHSWVLSRSRRSGSWDLFTKALDSDIADIQGGTTPEGIHLGAMAGTVDLVQRGYTGLETREGILFFNPRLPQRVQHLRFQMVYSHHPLAVDIAQDRFKVTVSPTCRTPLQIGFRKEVAEASPGDTLEFEL